jgi:hypothetical protein
MLKSLPFLLPSFLLEGLLLCDPPPPPPTNKLVSCTKACWKAVIMACDLVVVVVVVVDQQLIHKLDGNLPYLSWYAFVVHKANERGVTQPNRGPC